MPPFKEDDIRDCEECNGTGLVEDDCYACNGTGKDEDGDKCDECGGKGTFSEVNMKKRVSNVSSVDVAKIIYRTFRDRDSDCRVRTYSGRYMYGANCIGIVSSMSAATVMLKIALQIENDREYSLASVSHFFKNAREDSMGLDRIVYFPAISVTNSEFEDIEDDYDEEHEGDDE